MRYLVYRGLPIIEDYRIDKTGRHTNEIIYFVNPGYDNPLVKKIMDIQSYAKSLDELHKVIDLVIEIDRLGFFTAIETKFWDPEG